VNCTRRTEPGQRLGELRLADARHVLDQDVALGQQDCQGQADSARLAGDDGLHRGAYLPGDIHQLLKRPIRFLIDLGDHVALLRLPRLAALATHRTREYLQQHQHYRAAMSRAIRQYVL
jgi:hypothetical protein